MSNSIIDSIQLSGSSYDVRDKSATTVVEITQSDYDNLPSSAKTSNILYIITDGSIDYITSGQCQTQINNSISGKQDTLVSGTNIKTINNESILGSGNITIQGGGTDTGTVQTMIDQSISGKADSSTVTAIQDSLSGYVTTNTDQVVSSRKTFTNSDKAIEFKQVDNDSKVGFKVKNSASTANELASFEFRPNTFTIDGVQHPLMYFGHYRNINTANAGVPQTVIGFRQYDQKNAAAYHYLMPLPEKAKTPFSLSTTFKDYYAPIGFKNGSTMITADNTGVVDLSSELGGLKLKKLTQAQYDALATKDNSTLYVIVN